MDRSQPGVIYSESIIRSAQRQTETAIPVFIGYAEKGEVDKLYKIYSMKDYHDVLGGSPSGNSDSAAINKSVLYHTVRSYFDNGGVHCYICLLSTFSAAENETAQSFISRLVGDKLSNLITAEREISLVAVPDMVLLDFLTSESSEDISSLWGQVWIAVQGICEKRLELFGILECPVTVSDTLNTIDYVVKRISSLKRQKIAGYWPRLVMNYEGSKSSSSFSIGNNTVLAVVDGLSQSVSKTSSQAIERNNPDISVNAADKLHKLNEAEDITWLELPPSGAVIAKFAYTDFLQGIWAAPANMALSHVIKPAFPHSQANELFLEEGVSVNLIRSFPGRGIRVWGTRTLSDGTDLAGRYIQIRRLVNYIESSISEIGRLFIFEPNNELTWMKLKGQTISWLRELWQKGALAGVQESDAFRVLIGIDETMTEEDRLNGRMIMKIYISVLQPAEFIEIYLEFQASETITEQRFARTTNATAII